MLRHADDVKGQAASGSNREGERTEARRRGGAAHSSIEGPVMELEQKGLVDRADTNRSGPFGGCTSAG